MTPRELLLWLEQHQLRPPLQLRLAHGHSLEGQMVQLSHRSLVLEHRGQSWFVALDQIVAVGLLAGAELQQVLHPGPSFEPLSRLSFLRLSRDLFPPPLVLEFEGEEPDYGWLRPWLDQLSLFLKGLASDELGRQVLLRLQGLRLRSAPAPAAQLRGGYLEVEAEGLPPADLGDRLLSLF